MTSNRVFLYWLQFFFTPLTHIFHENWIIMQLSFSLDPSFIYFKAMRSLPSQQVLKYIWDVSQDFVNGHISYELKGIFQHYKIINKLLGIRHASKTSTIQNEHFSEKKYNFLNSKQSSQFSWMALYRDLHWTLIPKTQYWIQRLWTKNIHMMEIKDHCRRSFPQKYYGQRIIYINTGETFNRLPQIFS